MGLGGDGVKGESWDVEKSKGRKKKEGDVEETGCWIKLRFIGNCISSRSKVDTSTSVISTRCGNFKLEVLIAFEVTYFVMLASFNCIFHWFSLKIDSIL